MVATDKPRVGLQELLAKVGQYLPPDKQETIKMAYEYAAASHAGQRRASGDPYIQHPLNVALFLADLHLDATTIAASLLHDVLEDCGVEKEELEERFGAEITKLVDGVTKLSRLDLLALQDGYQGLSPEESQVRAESLRKMLVAMAEDVRVVLIKLADRLHNMRTLGALPPEKRRRIALETLDIYAPLAHRLGIANVKWQLEDLAFRHLEPARYRTISKMLATKRTEREAYVEGIVRQLKEELAKAGLKAEVTGRPKHIYSIYQKALKYEGQGKEINQIFDLYALRVLVRTTAECYHALGVVHSLWHPIPGQFDDYIANPKENMYQSLHTTVMCDGGTPLEVQVRTYEMHQVAEYGVAAHWRYKEGTAKDMRFEERMTWLRQLLEWQREVTGAEEFLESVKTDIFKDQVFVYTPKGDILELPAGATPVDFAYKVHTELGHRCVGAKVNGKLVSLEYQLHSGDTVEILTSKTARGPSLDWLNPNRGYVRTASAREKIRAWFRRQERSANIQRGKELLHKELKRLNMTVDETELARAFKLDSAEELHMALGSGGITIAQVVNRLAGSHERGHPAASHAPGALPGPDGTVQVMGVGDLLTRVGRCCNPIPGDDIVGFITRGRGVTVHRKSCPNLAHEDDQERFVRVEWGHARELYPVRVLIRSRDRVGLLRDVTTQVSEEGVNIAGVVTTEDDGIATIALTLHTTGLAQLSKLFSKLEGVRGVLSVVRDTGESAPSSRS